MTATVAHPVGDPMTGDRDPIAIDPPTALPTGVPTALPTGHIVAADLRTSPGPARRARWPTKGA
jgi:hypothetical protein